MKNQNDVIMRIILSLLLVLFAFKANAQDSKIIYILPDSVELLLFNKTTEDSVDCSKILYYLEKVKDDTMQITLIQFDKNKKTKSFASQLGMLTNRVVQIADKSYPLIFDYDFIFSTPNNKDIGTIGKREGYILKSMLLTHGYSIIFTLDGDFIRKGRGQ
ncbi:hypothetical protein [Polluticaenibacter yanchengensis]|uniref:hypothetical protein n=1 Tax=Polluticaenibacter yanchengensis TaxID=3014562 RepID=UPI00387B0BED